MSPNKDQRSVKPRFSARSLLGISPNDVRIGPVHAIPAVLSELGVTPQRAFAAARVDPELFDNPDGRISFNALGRLLETCIALTQVHHFGLLVGKRFDLHALGPLGYLMRNSATVGDALRSLSLHLHLHDRGAAPILMSPATGSTMLGYSVYRHDTPALAQIYDTAIAIGYRIMAQLCGPSWKPLRVQFSYSAPENAAPHRELFGSRVVFDAEVSGIVFSSRWLKEPVEGADPVLHGIVDRAIRAAETRNPMTFAEQVKAVLPQMVLGGTVSANAVASLFGVSERTLRRRLEGEESNLQQLLNEARFEMSRQLLGNTALTVSQVAAALRYADPNIFSRAFRTWAGLSPTQWRAEIPSSEDATAEDPDRRPDA